MTTSEVPQWIQQLPNGECLVFDPQKVKNYSRQNLQELIQRLDQERCLLRSELDSAGKMLRRKSVENDELKDQIYFVMENNKLLSEELLKTEKSVRNPKKLNSVIEYADNIEIDSELYFEEASEKLKLFLEDKIQTLEEKLLNSKGEVESLLAENLLAVKEMKKLKFEKEAVEFEFTAYKDSSSKKIRTLTAALQEAKDKNKDKKAEISSLKEKNKDLHSEILYQKKNYQFDTVVLQEKINNFFGIVENYKEKIEELKKENFIISQEFRVKYQNILDTNKKLLDKNLKLKDKLVSDPCNIKLKEKEFKFSELKTIIKIQLEKIYKEILSETQKHNQFEVSYYILHFDTFASVELQLNKLLSFIDDALHISSRKRNLTERKTIDFNNQIIPTIRSN